MNPSPPPPQARRKRSPRCADAPIVRIFDLPSPEELYDSVTAEFSARAHVVEQQRSYLAALSKGATALQPPARPRAGQLSGSPPIPTNRLHHDVLLGVESATTAAYRLEHLTSHPTPSIVEARMTRAAAADAISALHLIICQPPLLP
ncbi:hypothetical protein LSCM1_00642 [Leishmania martiniquensis]|uniref:Uncharacterized protein n=1 Tax=Leishmania martiniquensis TaxID=1580590 RepID=A0A836G355_9TRYP|nr:hypothetical protein LSCM1_00642 [Leishmania martiniquensis]